VTPPLPPDFPDIPQNPPSELRPPLDPSARPDKVEGTNPFFWGIDRSLRGIRQSLFRACAKGFSSPYASWRVGPVGSRPCFFVRVDYGLIKSGCGRRPLGTLDAKLLARHA
jgi:hypothetical protein